MPASRGGGSHGEPGTRGFLYRLLPFSSRCGGGGVLDSAQAQQSYDVLALRPARAVCRRESETHVPSRPLAGPSSWSRNSCWRDRRRYPGACKGFRKSSLRVWTHGKRRANSGK
ncbi:protein dpy-30 homolog isoform X2 [Monodelphis domestica]|uniref:protein dpy-30 homolog isoform X2 n=1 Tax=Monodelphis domestica TaxID=13616 RepID=UPI0024E23194|nr:protein dpy-30 homolog isoform X2 [Monodelphis domestica]